jgi:hypothetical protein
MTNATCRRCGKGGITFEGDQLGHGKEGKRRLLLAIHIWKGAHGISQASHRVLEAAG